MYTYFRSDDGTVAVRYSVFQVILPWKSYMLSQEAFWFDSVEFSPVPLVSIQCGNYDIHAL